MTTAADARPDLPRWSSVAIAALIGVAVGLATGWIVLGLTRPSDDELQRAALDEIGLPAALEDAPVIGHALDTYTDRIEARITAESRSSAGLALAVAVIIAVATTTVASHTAFTRTNPTDPHQSDDSMEVAHGRRH